MIMPPLPNLAGLSPDPLSQMANTSGSSTIYQHIFEAMGDGLILHDVKSNLVAEANLVASAMHGYTREEFIGLPVTAFIHPDSHHLLPIYIQAAESQGRFEALAVHMSRDGSPLQVEVRGTTFVYQGRLCLLSVVRLVNAQFYEQAQTLATLQERQRLARNLHDVVNQSLFSAGLIAEVLPRLWEQNQDEGRHSLEDLRRLTWGALAEMRGLLADLRPQVLIDSELGDLLRQLGSAFTGRTNIPVAVTIIGERDLPADVQVAFYRLCQEGLTNIAKHARASQVRLCLQYEAGVVELHINDDGRGFDPKHTPSGHYGLGMMRERAQVAGVILKVISRPGHGTEIFVRWLDPSKQKAL